MRPQRARSKNATALLALLALAACGDEPSGEQEPAPAKGATDQVAATDQATETRKKPTLRLRPYEPVPWDHESNWFQNPSFEEGREPWVALRDPFTTAWQDFDVTDKIAASGEKSARFLMTGIGEKHDRTRVWGVVYDVQPKTLPRRITGRYRVDDWVRGPRLQFLQVAVSVAKVGNIETPNKTPVQIAWVLAGIERDPFPYGNRKFLFLGPSEPVTGEWIDFDIDLHQGFLDTWGAIPKPFTGLRVLFEARYERADEWDATRLSGTVYYDDLYMGNGG